MIRERERRRLLNKKVLNAPAPEVKCMCNPFLLINLKADEKNVFELWLGGQEPNCALIYTCAAPDWL